MSRLAPPEHGATCADAGVATTISSECGPRADHRRAPAINLKLLTLAQIYLRAHRHGHATGPSSEAAWSTFFESLVPVIRAYAQICRCTPTDLDDGLQDVCSVLIVHLPNYIHDGTRGRFHDWLFVVVRRTLAKQRRRDQRSRFGTLGHQEAIGLVGRESDPAEDFKRRELIDRIQYALEVFRDRVDSWAFRVVALHWIEGLSITEIACELHLSRGQIRGCLTRVKPLLRGCFEQHGVAAPEK